MAAGALWINAIEVAAGLDARRRRCSATQPSGQSQAPGSTHSRSLPRCYRSQSPRPGRALRSRPTAPGFKAKRLSHFWNFPAPRGPFSPGLSLPRAAHLGPEPLHPSAPPASARSPRGSSAPSRRGLRDPPHTHPQQPPGAAPAASPPAAAATAAPGRPCLTSAPPRCAAPAPPGPGPAPQPSAAEPGPGRWGPGGASVWAQRGRAPSKRSSWAEGARTVSLTS